MTAYYNEIDKFAAAWLRELVKENLIAPGEVDDRSIEEVQPEDLKGFTQAHFFGGIGVWSYALRLAGWPDDRPVWTGSCPCPSFSAAGKGQGFNDPRHLWPHWYRLIRECRPATIIGEQVDQAIGHGWLDLVQSDLENEDYAIGKAVLGACSVGAPHRRQRLYFVAYSECNGRRTNQSWRRSEGRITAGRHGEVGSLAQSDGGIPGNGELQRSGQHRLFAQDGGTGQLAQPGREFSRRRNQRSAKGAEQNRARTSGESERPSCAIEGGELSNSPRRGFGMHGSASRESGHTALAEQTGVDLGESSAPGLPPRESENLQGAWWRQEGRTTAEPSLTSGFWRDAQWIYCSDGKYRPTKPGLFPLAHGVAGRVGTLRGAGNAIVAPLAAEFIKAFMEC